MRITIQMPGTSTFSKQEEKGQSRGRWHPQLSKSERSASRTCRDKGRVEEDGILSCRKASAQLLGPAGQKAELRKMESSVVEKRALSFSDLPG